jgi:hypothetical protein
MSARTNKAKCSLFHLATNQGQPIRAGERPASWWRSRLIPCRRVGLCPLGSIPPLSAHLPLRRFAALSSTSLAHVMGFASSKWAADRICARSPSVNGIRIPAVLRSLGFLGGLPIRLFSIPLNIYRKTFASTLVRLTNYVYNKSRQRKTPATCKTLPGQLKPAFADSSLGT